MCMCCPTRSLVSWAHVQHVLHACSFVSRQFSPMHACACRRPSSRRLRGSHQKPEVGPTQHLHACHAHACQCEVSGDGQSASVAVVSLSLLVSLFVHDLMHHVPSGVHDVSFMCSLFFHRQCALIEFHEASHAMRHDQHVRLPRSATCSCMQWNWDGPCHAPDWQFMSRPCIFHACRMCHFLFLQILDSASFDSQREREREAQQKCKLERQSERTKRQRETETARRQSERQRT